MSLSLQPGEFVHVVVEVSMPDRPGALGLVASRVGAVGGNITDLVVSRGASPALGRAVDTFHVDVQKSETVDVVDLLCHEIDEVDGVEVVTLVHGGSCCEHAAPVPS